MHYLRLLRPPSLAEGRPTVLHFVLTITTDLGDAFYAPDAPQGISVVLETESARQEETVLVPPDASSPSRKRKREGSAELRRDAPDTAPDTLLRHTFLLDKPAHKTQSLQWTGGMRVLKMGVVVPLAAMARLRDPDVVRARVGFHMADRSLSLHTAQEALTADSSHALVPLWVDVPAAGHAFPHVAVRTLRLDHDPHTQQAVDVQVEEELGESIARHIWDAGLATVAFLADTCLGDNPKDKTRRAPDAALADALHGLLIEAPRLHILELGCGVGILGIGLATILRHVRTQHDDDDDGDGDGDDVSLLLTDLPEAAERVRANMERARRSEGAAAAADNHVHYPPLSYENLDWDAGCVGQLGTQVTAGRPWELVVLSDCTYNVDMLPALVQTLSALQGLAAASPLHVLLARKPRHTDEEALFGLLSDHGWRQSASSTVPLPAQDGRKEVLELYLYRKGGDEGTN